MSPWHLFLWREHITVFDHYFGICSWFQMERTKLWIDFVIKGPSDLTSSEGSSFIPGVLFIFWHLIADYFFHYWGFNIPIMLDHNYCRLWWLSCMRGVHPQNSLFLHLQRFALIHTPQALHCVLSLTAIVAICTNLPVTRVDFLYFALTMISAPDIFTKSSVPWQCELSGFHCIRKLCFGSKRK